MSFGITANLTPATGFPVENGIPLALVSGSWTCQKSGRYLVIITGGGSGSTYQEPGTGGATMLFFVSLFAGNVYDYIIGAGGTAAPWPASAGGESYFGHLAANGGGKRSHQAGGWLTNNFPSQGSGLGYSGGSSPGGAGSYPNNVGPTLPLQGGGSVYGIGGIGAVPDADAHGAGGGIDFAGANGAIELWMS